MKPFLVHFKVSRGMWLFFAMLLGLPSGSADPVPVQPVRQAIARAVEFLRQAQQPDGSVRVYQCRDAALTECVPDHATEPTAVVLMGLSEVRDPRAMTLMAQGAQFLRAQMDDEGFFIYHAKSHPHYPDQPRDIEATCFIRSVLEPLGVSLPSVIPQLAAFQTPDGTFYPFALPLADVKAIKAGGPAHDQFTQRYHRGPGALRMVDVVEPVANAQVLGYLAAIHQQVPTGLCDYLVRVCKGDAALAAKPVWDGSPYLVTHGVSRAYRFGARCLEPAKAVLQAGLPQQQRPDGSWGSVIDTALAASSLMHVDYSGRALDQAVRFLLSQQQPDGSWERAVWWGIPSRSVWSGSEEVSTGYALETLGQYLKGREAAPL